MTRAIDAHALRRVCRDGLLYALIAVSLVVLLFPIAWMVSTAFKSRFEVFQVPPVWIPRQPTLAAFATIATGDMVRFFLNSMIVAGGAALVSTTAGALAAYGLSRVRFRLNNAVLMFFLASMAFPLPLLMISIYTMFARLGLLDTYLALILGHSFITLPIVVWLLKGFFDALPVEVEESAFIDGAGPLRTLALVVLPMSRSGLAAAAIYVFVTSWNEFILGLTFTSSQQMRPLPAGISLRFLQEFQYQWAEMMAVAVVATAPILLLFLLFQRNFIEGVTSGAVKG